MFKRIFHIDHVIITLLALLIMWLLSFVVLNVTFFDPISRALKNYQLSDMFYQIEKDSGVETESPLITIVDISSVYDRSQIAKVIEDINECEPYLLGIDVIFEGLKGDTVGSDAIAEALMNSEKPVVAFKLTVYDNKTKEFTHSRHSFFTPSEGIVEGFSNVAHDAYGGALRYITTVRDCHGEKVYALAQEIARTYYPELPVDTVALTKRMIDYTPTIFPVVAHDSILQHRDLLNGRIVILGGMHDDADMHYSPYGRTAGTNIQAYAVQTLLENKRIEEFPPIVATLISFLLILFTQIFRYEFGRWANARRHLFLRTFFGSTLVNNIINFTWIGLLVWINFIIFIKFDYYFPSTLTLLAIAMLIEAQNFYRNMIQYIGNNYNWSFAKNSLYNINK